MSPSGSGLILIGGVALALSTLSRSLLMLPLQLVSYTTVTLFTLTVLNSLNFARLLLMFEILFVLCIHTINTSLHVMMFDVCTVSKGTLSYVAAPQNGWGKF